jgi:hypothetical protein
LHFAVEWASGKEEPVGHGSALDALIEFYRSFNEAANARVDSAHAAQELVILWSKRLGRLLDAGAAGFRVINPHHVPSHLWHATLVGLRDRSPGFIALAWTPGLKWSQIDALGGPASTVCSHRWCGGTTEPDGWSKNTTSCEE